MVDPEAPPLDVLVVDDDPAVARLVAVVLEREGLAVGRAHGAAEARAALAERPCRLVLTDYTMPETSGLELVRALDGAGVRAGFLVMSAFLEPAVMAELCGDPAVAGVIRKPFELAELLRDVRAALAAGDASGAPPGSSQAPPSPASPSPEPQPKEEPPPGDAPC